MVGITRKQKSICEICANRMTVFLSDMYDDRYGCPGRFVLERCSSCGQIETFPRLADEQLPSLYSTYYPHGSVDLRLLRNVADNPNSIGQRLKKWLNGTNNQGHYYSKDGMKVLDYGCGSGLSLLEIARLGAQGYGVETNPAVRKAAAEFGLNIHIGSLSENPFPGIIFDLIVLNQVIEHIPDPCSLLEKLSRRLTNDGKIVLSFPNTDSLYRRMFGRRWINWHIPYHLHHFNRRSFRLLCSKLGLRCSSWRTVTPNLWTILQIRMYLQPSKPGAPSAIWVSQPTEPGGNTRPSSYSSTYYGRIAAALLRRVNKIAVSIAIPVITTLLNRIIDSLRMGDSLVVVVTRR